MTSHKIEAEKQEVERLVKALPEIYQPVFGYDEFSKNVSRDCKQRLNKILTTYHALSAHLNRPLKVLDLGCAQGFISLSLAKAGAEVLGVDFSKDNIALCSKLSELNLDLNAEFTFGRIEEVIATLKLEDFDIVLGLSVFHHLVHEHGVPEIQALIANLAQKVKVLILELALQEEPLYWGPSQPERPEELLDNCDFVYELAKCSTHLSHIERPLLIASNHYWVIGEHADRIKKVSNQSFSADWESTSDRKYFYSKNSILIKYGLQEEQGLINQNAFERTLSVYATPPSDFKTADFICSARNENSGWLAFKPFKGGLLYDWIKDDAPIDEMKIIFDVLSQLIALEKQGLYFNDLRTWNVFLSEEGTAYLIDYESITSTKEDVQSPMNVYVSFLVFVNDLINRNKICKPGLRLLNLNLISYPEPYSSWISSLLKLEMNKEITFSRIKNLLSEVALSKAQTHSKEKSSVLFSDYLFDVNQELLLNAAKWFEQFEKGEERLRTLTEKSDSLEIKVKELYDSHSWKVTAPLRWLSSKCKSV